MEKDNRGPVDQSAVQQTVQKPVPYHGPAPKPAQQGPDPKADKAKEGSHEAPNYDGLQADD